MRTKNAAKHRVDIAILNAPALCYHGRKSHKQPWLYRVCLSLLMSVNTGKRPCFFPSYEILKKGKIVDRYGYDSGNFLAPEGTSFEARGMPAELKDLPYTKFKVKKPFSVLSGETRPWFGQPGKGIQYNTPITVEDLIKGGYLEVIK